MADKKNTDKKKTSASTNKGKAKGNIPKKDVEKTVKKVYKKTKASAKKKGKLKTFYIFVALILVLAVAGGAVWYFYFYDGNDNGAAPNTFTNYKFDDFNDIVTTDVVFSRGELEVHYVNVGQADCILILLPDGRNMIIDGGENNKATEAHLKEYIDNLGIDTFDYLMLTHCDSDHVGSLDFILDNYQVKNMFVPDLLPSYKAGSSDNEYLDVTSKTQKGTISTKVYYDFFSRTDDETYLYNNRYLPAKVYKNVGEMNITGDNYTIDIYCMDDNYYADINSNSGADKKNAISPTVVINYMGRKMVFTGDGIGESHQAFMDMVGGQIYDCDVYKVAHHGSGTHASNNLEFLKYIQTEFAIISVEEGKYNDVPSTKVIDNLKMAGNTVYRTDKCGDIRLEISDNGKISFASDKNNDRIFSENELVAA